MAYAPYGEDYDGSGTQDLAFTDQNQDTAGGGWSSNLYDFLMREYRTAHGRWTSPDPAGLGAVNPASPQTWNRYAYVTNNPLTFTDPLGLTHGSGGSGQCDQCDQTFIPMIDTRGGGSWSGGNGGYYGGAGSLCSLDGLDVPCSSLGGLGSSAITQVFPNPQSGAKYGLGPSGTWTNLSNGEELSDASVAELGLPSADAASTGGCAVTLGGVNLSFWTCPFAGGNPIVNTNYRLKRTGDCFDGVQRQSNYSLQNADGTGVSGSVSITEFQTNPYVTPNQVGTSTHLGSVFPDTIGPSLFDKAVPISSSRIFTVSINGQFVGAVPVTTEQDYLVEGIWWFWGPRGSSQVFVNGTLAKKRCK